MAIAPTHLGTGTNTNGTTASTTVTTTAGVPYAVISSGAYNGAAGEYNALTISGVTSTQVEFDRWYGARRILLGFDTFVGSGGSETVTVTMGSSTGSPTLPICAVAVVEMAGSSGPDRTISANANSTLNVTTGTVNGGAALPTGNVGLSAVSMMFFAYTSLVPNNGETELLETNVVHTTGTTNAGGTDLTLQIQYGPNDAGSWAALSNVYGCAQAFVEYDEPPDPTIPLLTAPAPLRSRSNYRR